MYIAGFNQPGYLPESDPEEFDSFKDARDYLVQEMRLALEADDENEIDDGNVEDFAAELYAETGPFSALGPDGYAYWVTEA